jgi:hypothetical protein
VLCACAERLETARKECETLLKIGNNQVKWLGIFAGLLSMLQIVCGTGIMVGQSMGLDTKVRLALAWSLSNIDAPLRWRVIATRRVGNQVADRAVEHHSTHRRSRRCR